MKHAGNNVVVEFNAKGRIVQALGRRLEPWVYVTHVILDDAERSSR